MKWSQAANNAERRTWKRQAVSNMGSSINMAEAAAKENSTVQKTLIVSSSPHLVDQSSSQKVMLEVTIGTLPAIVMSMYYFRGPAAVVLVSCVVGCLATEWVFNKVRRKAQTLTDFSALVTAIILGLSLPPSLPYWAAILGSVVAIAVSKMLFGGLGSNIFNPAMVGRAFLMACFGTMMTAWTPPATISVDQEVAAVTQPTPLALAKQPIKDAANEDKTEKATPAPANSIITDMFVGSIKGSAGETSALAWLIGGLFLLWRRTITWHIPVAVLGSSFVAAAIPWLLNQDVYPNPLVHLFGGGLMMCAFFIATDPVSCPLTKTGRLVFGAGVGILIMVIRLGHGLPEGVMYAILLMNSVTPLVDGWTRPKPVGGPTKKIA